MKLNLQYSPAMDLIGAFFIWSCWEQLEQNSRSHNIPEEMLRWKAHCDRSVPRILKDQSQALGGEFILLILSPLKAIHIHQLHQPESLLTFLKNLSGRELTEWMLKGENLIYSPDQLLENPSKGRETLKKSNGTVRPGEQEHFVDFLTFSDYYKNQFVQALSLFYRIAVLPFEEEVTLKAQFLLDQDRQVASKSPEDYLTTRIHLKSEQISDQIPQSIYLSYYDFWDIILLNDPYIALYGWQNQFQNDQPTVEEIYSLLNDETRRSILQNLSRRSMFSREIAEACGLTPSTVSYHMTRFYSMGLIQHRPGPRKRIIHELNKERLEKLLERVKSDLIG